MSIRQANQIAALQKQVQSLEEQVQSLEEQVKVLTERVFPKEDPANEKVDVSSRRKPGRPPKNASASA